MGTDAYVIWGYVFAFAMIFIIASVIQRTLTGEPELVDRLMKLDGFDVESWWKAMSCTQKQRFIVWKKSPMDRIDDIPHVWASLDG